eukprot:TRINITY_DN521_c0_g1_i1.p1 TRINITY_DN521_c0_g1~~TRINITY_DN521_c0_g1_i1.p1  ORF type:complete len:196 (+),score=42.90 TRINITY_DN521_c0_g1_i1:81-590(+)
MDISKLLNTDNDNAELDLESCRDDILVVHGSALPTPAGSMLGTASPQHESKISFPLLDLQFLSDAALLSSLKRDPQAPKSRLGRPRRHPLAVPGTRKCPRCGPPKPLHCFNGENKVCNECLDKKRVRDRLRRSLQPDAQRTMIIHHRPSDLLIPAAKRMKVDSGSSESH